MTLRPEYSLGHSEYNAFLFAAVGEGKVGLPLTVLTFLITRSNLLRQSGIRTRLLLR